MILVNEKLFKYQNLGLFVGRVALGIIMFIHGIGKLMGGAKAMTAVGSAMGAFGVPPEFFYAAGLLGAGAELLGGLFTALGLFTRLSSFFLIGTMAVAITVTYKAGFNVCIQIGL